MLTIAMLGLIGYAISEIAATLAKADRWDVWGWHMWGGALGGIVGLIVAIGMGLVFDAPTVRTMYKPLVAFNDGSSVQGHMFLGTGTIESKDAYFYYESAGADSFKRGRLVDDKVGTSASVIIRETAPKGEGYLESFEKEYIWWQWWLVVDPNPTQYVFTVPKGTVVRQFVADLKD